MIIIYDLIFIIFAIIYLPYLFLRKKLHKDFIQRLGFIPDGLQAERPLWIHAVSVGEARVAEALVKQLRLVYPGTKFVFSVVTTTGNKIIRGFKSESDFLFYLPLDLSFITKKVIRRIKPSACIIIETEIWPNLITQLNKAAIPIILVNARLSDSSFFGYRIAQPLIKPVLNRISLFCAQSQRDAERLSALGVRQDKITTTGNMKYDIIDNINTARDSLNYRLSLGIKERGKLFVAGSTHPQEEEIILSAYQELSKEFPGLKLLIAPRHPERAASIENLVSKSGFQPVLVSRLSLSLAPQPESAVFILDTIGQLIHFYAACDIVFVGGSLVKKGGQNILEPALFKKPVIFGPHMFNFRDISNLFLAKQAARLVHNQEELLKEARFLLNNPAELEGMGSRARQLLLENQGATKRNVEKISLLISHG
ncbi:MAG: 3-deoxy-D-manno-octulosonic acid transferase [Candidatus Omnitrophica bacterium]|nr:3-deoxy-D-manno-octulosonic acid transferase [Candidatus Omnitrophota bacterium]